LSDAVIVAVPEATAATLNVALDEPAGIVMAVCTVATAGALLVSEMLAPLIDAAAVRLTVPCPLAPTARLVMLRATPDTLAVVGAVGDEPHRVTRTAAITIVANLAKRVARRLVIIRVKFLSRLRARFATRSRYSMDL
jgi:hypothetical protein